MKISKKNILNKAKILIGYLVHEDITNLSKINYTLDTDYRNLIKYVKKYIVIKKRGKNYYGKNLYTVSLKKDLKKIYIIYNGLTETQKDFIRLLLKKCEN